MRNATGMGPAGNCICPRCDYKLPHERGVPCREMRCPECGARMLREGSEHHQLLLKKRASKENEKEE